MNTANKAFSFIRKNKLTLVITAVVVVALLIAASTFSGSKKNTESSSADDGTLVAELEQRVGNLLCSVDGVGRCEVVIYVSSGSENVYAQKTTTGTGSVSSSVEVVGSSDSETPVLIKTLSPCITGVAVVCDGGGSFAVKNEIKDILSVLLGIDASSISVSRKK